MGNEVAALLEVAGEAVDRLAITPAESLHRAVARRVFGAVGPASAPARVLHNGIARAVYAGVRFATSTAFASAAGGARLAAAGAEVRPLSRSRRGRLIVSAVNALLGDRLEERGSDLAIPMSVRAAGGDVACEATALGAAFPSASSRVAIFLHGLGENEELWPGRERLAITAVDVRYNTGLHVSQNGALLARLLEALVAAWPVPVADLFLVGHSMGGLVARSACHAGSVGGHAWPARMRHLVTLGTPHTGAPLEKAVHSLSWALRKLPEAAPLAGILDHRSAGIRDLRYGYLLEAEWSSEDDRKLIDDRRLGASLLPNCAHTFITATITRDPRHPLGWLVGDLLVRTESAAGRHRARSIPVPPGSVIHLGPLTHFDLLGHPLVYARLDAVFRDAPADPQPGPPALVDRSQANPAFPA